MTLKIRRAVVLGSGVMGAQIAALVAASGVRVHLLDLASDSPSSPNGAPHNRSQIALKAIENLKKLSPSPLMSPEDLKSLIAGNFDDDFSVIADADWVIEVVVERLDIKQKIHSRIAEYVRPGVPVTTNTSGIHLADMVGHLTTQYQEAFFGTHFFNPPRYMNLVELIAHQRTNRDLFTKMSEWLEEKLGKGTVIANDTVNFIANRIGVFNLQATLKYAKEFNLNFETIDTLTGKLIGRPTSATFRTLDVVGLDTYALVSQNVYDKAKNDPYRDYFLQPQWLETLIKSKRLGQKSGSVGCYQKTKDAKGATIINVYRPETDHYEAQKADEAPWTKEAFALKALGPRLKFIFSRNDPYAQFLWNVFSDTFSYCALLIEEIASGSPFALDSAMRWGFNWELGPFELWQAIGYDEVLKRMIQEKKPLPESFKMGLEFYSPTPGSDAHLNVGFVEELSLPSGKPRKLQTKPYYISLPVKANHSDARTVATNSSASLIDIGHGVACLTFHSKMNALDDEIIDLMQKSVALVNQKFEALVIANYGSCFSAGANLKRIIDLIDQNDFLGIDTLIRRFQGTLSLLKFAPFPVISCPHGLTLGGGCEVSLHSHARVLYGETYAGLVEAGVGLIPAAGGLKELALRAYQHASKGDKVDPMAFLRQAFWLVGMGKTSTSGKNALEIGLYDDHTLVSLSKNHQLHKAKTLALSILATGFKPLMPASSIPVVGDPGIQTFKMILYNMQEGRFLSSHDALIGEKIATVLCGGAVDPGTLILEQTFLDLERQGFVELCQTPKTKERIQFMLAQGKPLRN